MNLPRMQNVPHVGTAQIHTEHADAVVVMPDGATSCDLFVVQETEAGKVSANITLGRKHAIEMRDALTEAIDTMPGEL